MMEITTKLSAPSSMSVTITSILIRFLRSVLVIVLLILSILIMRYNRECTTINYETATFLEKLTSILLHTLHSHFEIIDSNDSIFLSLFHAIIQVVKIWIPRLTAFSLTVYLGVVYGYVGFCQLNVVRPFRSRKDSAASVTSCPKGWVIRPSISNLHRKSMNCEGTTTKIKSRKYLVLK